MDFVYRVYYKEGLETYLKWTRQINEEGKKVSTNSESDGRFHSNWLNMMYPRLKLARNLLTADGVIFISIDDNEIDNLTRLGKEVFGEANYLNTFVWVSNLKGRQISASGAAGTKEYIVAFARNADQAGEFRASANELKKVMPSIYKGFNYEAKHDEHGPYVTKNELHNTNSAFNEVTRPNLVFDIYYRPSDGAIRTEPVSDEHVHVGFDKISPKKNNNGVNKYHAYRWSTPKIAAEPHNIEFVKAASGWKIFTKVRDVDSTTVKDLVMDITTSAGSADISALGLDASWFDYPKPLALIKSLIRFGAGVDSIVLDFFAGSGTTAQAVLELNAEDSGNRRFIQVQLPEPLDPTGPAAKAGQKTIADIARVRITKVLNVLGGQLQGKQLDLGFRGFKLADTNFTKWHVTSDADATALEKHILDLRDSANDDATPESLLMELLLKQGYSLTELIDDVEIEGLALKSVGDNLVLTYLDKRVKPTLEQLRKVVEQKPARFIILEDVFQGDDELKTNLVQECKSRDVELWTA
jgi:adenine-specific DNA-methyltransferase